MRLRFVVGLMTGALLFAISALASASSLREQESMSAALVPQLGHSRSVHSVAYSPDGGRIATAGDEGTAQVWDAVSGEVVAILEGHEGPVRSVVYSPESDRIATAGVDGMVRVWDAGNGEVVATLVGHDGSVQSVAYSPDGDRIATAGVDGMVRVWDVDNGQVVATLVGHDGSVQSVAYSPNGDRIAAAGADGMVRMWDVDNGQVVATLVGDGSVQSVAYSPDGDRIVAAGVDGMVRVWDVDNGQVVATLEGHDGPVQSVVYSPNGGRIATAGFDGLVRIWDALSGTVVAVLEGHTGSVNSVAYNQDGRRIASSGDDGTVRVRNVARSDEVTILRGISPPRISAVVLSPSAELVAVATEDHEIRFWSVESGTSVHTLTGHLEEVEQLSFSGNGEQIIAVGPLMTTVWNVESGRSFGTTRAKNAVSVTYSPDGKRLAAAGDDGLVRMWDAASGELVKTLDRKGGAVQLVVYSPDGRYIAGGGGELFSDETVRVWDAANGELVATFNRGGAGVGSIVYSPDGRYIASGRIEQIDIDGGSELVHDVRVWNALNGELVRTFEIDGESNATPAAPASRSRSDTSVAYSPNGRHIAAGNGGTVQVWDVESGERMVILESREARIWSLAYSPDGRYIAAGSLDGTVRMWHLATGDEVALESPDSQVGPVTYSPDGRHIAAGGNDGTVIVWEVESGEQVAALQRENLVWSLAYSPDGLHIAAGSRTGTLRVWDVESGAAVPRFAGHDIVSVTYNSDRGRFASVGTDGIVREWDADSGEMTTPLGGDGESARSVAYSPDGGRIAITGLHGVVQVWDVVDRSDLVAVLDGDDLPIQSAAFSPDGRRIVTAGLDGVVRVWDSNSGEEVVALEGEGGSFQSVVYSPDGGRFAAAGFDGVVRVWDADSAEEVAILNGLQGFLQSIVYSSDGRRIAASNYDGTVWSWDVATSDLIAIWSASRRQSSIWLSDRNRSDPPLTVQLLSSEDWITYQRGHLAYVASPNADDERSGLVRIRFDDAQCGLCATLGSSERPLYALEWYKSELRNENGTIREKLSNPPPTLHPKVLRMVATLVLDLIMRHAVLPVALAAIVALLYQQWKKSKQRRRLAEFSQPILRDVRRFFEQAGATVSVSEGYSLIVRDAPPPLESYTPLPALIATDAPTEEDIQKLLEARSNEQATSDQAGLLIYVEAPDALARLAMCTVRLGDSFIVIPIPHAEVTLALRNSTSDKLLFEYTNRYLPGADLFDDRQSISDAVTFFGRTQLLRRLREELIGSRQNVGLFGLRKSGKTSVLLQLRYTLQRQMPSHPVVYCDLQLYGERAYYGSDLFNDILKQLCDLIDGERLSRAPRFSLFPSDTPAATLVSKFADRVTTLVRILRHIGFAVPILCLLDEVERVLPTSEDSLEKVREFNAFFGALRGLGQQHGAMTLLVADVVPDCNRINHWPQRGATTNPVYTFFKEIFLAPLSQDESVTMLRDLGGLMGRRFDDRTVQRIHQESNGHPFIARQLASVVCNEVSDEGRDVIRWSKARRYVEEPFRYAPVRSANLKEYCRTGVSDEVERRGLSAANTVLRYLSMHGPGVAVTENVLRARLIEMHGEGDLLDALVWLESVGLVSREEVGMGLFYKVMPLLSRWLRVEADRDGLRRL